MADAEGPVACTLRIAIAFVLENIRTVTTVVFRTIGIRDGTAFATRKAAGWYLFADTALGAAASTGW